MDKIEPFIIIVGAAVLGYVIGGEEAVGYLLVGAVVALLFPR